MSTIVTPSVTYTTWVAGEVAVPCDYSDQPWCRQAPAKWVLWVMCEACLHATPRLAGDDCKDFLVHTEEMLECQSCGTVRLARWFLKRIDAI